MKYHHYSPPTATDMPAKLSYASAKAFVCDQGRPPSEHQSYSLFKLNLKGLNIYFPMAVNRR